MTTTELITLEGDKPIYASQLNDNFDLLNDNITALTNSTNASIQNINTTISSMSGNVANAAKKNAANTFTAANTFSGAVACSGAVALNGTTTAVTQTAGNNTTRVATTAFVQTAVSGGYAGGTIAGGKNRTVLYSTNTNDGDITLSEAFTNFHQLAVIGCADGNSTFNVVIHDTWFLNYLLDTYSDVCIYTGGSDDKWVIKSYSGGTTTKKFKVDTENCRIRRIVGINRK